MGNQGVTMWHYYLVDFFVSVIDMLLHELNNRFNEINVELLYSTACFSPLDSFHAFDIDKLVKLGKFYPHDFSDSDLMELEHQIKIYIVDMRNDDRFGNLKVLGELSQMLVMTKKMWCIP